MKYLSLVAFILISTIIFGCSKGNITSPPSISEVQDNDAELVVLETGRMNLETGETEPLRGITGYMDVTSFVGTNFSYTIEEMLPPDILRITLQIDNVSTLTVYDVCIVFDNTYGKKVQWPDLHLDIFEPLDINPAIAFRSEDPERAFPPGIDTEAMYISFPDGANPNVDYFIIAHLGGNTGGVTRFFIYQDEGRLYTSGGDATLRAYVRDYQDDVSMVVANTSVLTGGYTYLTPLPEEPGYWGANITNSKDAPIGIYTIIAMATSPSTPQYNVYDEFDVRVCASPGSTIYVDDDNTSGPWHGSIDYPFQYIQDAVDYVSDYCTIWVKPGTYYEDEGGSSSEGDAEITVDFYGLVNNLTIYGEDMPKIVLHEYDGTIEYGAIKVNNCNDVVIDGFEFTPAPFYRFAVLLNHCTNAEVRNCKITPAPAQGFSGFLRANDCPGLIVENNICDNLIVNSTTEYWASRFISVSECEDGRLSLNTVRNLQQLSTPAGTGQYSYSIINVYGSDRIEISKNIIGDITWSADMDYMSFLTAIHVDSCDDSETRHNLIYDITFNGLNDESYVDELTGIEVSYSNQAMIYNNTLDSLMMDTISEHETCIGITIGLADILPYSHSNIITRIHASNAYDTRGFSSSETAKQEYSDVWDIGGGSGERYYWEAIEGTGGIDADPEFVDYLNYDYHLMVDSPCEGTGLGDWDMGCYGGPDPLP